MVLLCRYKNVLDKQYTYMYTHIMGNKTIYVSSKDEKIYEEAQQIAGEALSSVIARALSEFVTRSKEKKDGMKEISIKVGSTGSEREQRFVGTQLGKWEGLNDDKSLLQSAKVYLTSKGNVAILLSTNSKATLLTDPKAWHKNAEYLETMPTTELFVAEKPEQLKGQIPANLIKVVQELQAKEVANVEYLNI